MRSERKRRRTFLARFMVLFMIINLLSGVNPSVLKADTATNAAHFKDYTLEKTDDATNIKLTQKAENYNDGIFDVEMTVEGNEDSTTQMHSLDVVLAIDTSNSMGEPLKWPWLGNWEWNLTYERLNNAKRAAKSFAEILLKDSKNKVRVAVVGFGDIAYTKAGLTSDKRVINNAIDDLDLTGATYTQDALKMADRILNNNSNADQKKIVLLSDGVPTYGYYKGEKIGSGLEVTGQIKKALYFEADTIKRKGISITTVGIGVDATGKSILERVAKDSGGYKAANEFGSNLDEILKDLAEEIVNKKVNDGKFVIPMADYVKFKDNLTYEVTTKGIKNENLTKAIKTTKPDSDKNLIFDSLTLGKDDKLIIKYKAELVEKRKDDKYYNITKTSPELFLTSSSNDKIVFDEIMKVKDLKTVNLVINKQWVGPVPTGVDSVEFNILPNNDAIKKAIVKKDNEWKTTVEGLPRYKDGEKIIYKLQENIPQDATYEISKNERSDAVNGDIIFNVTNKNTEKVDYVVTKKWGNTPSELQFATNVQLYDGENKVNNRLVTLKDNNWTATFTDLPKYNDNGDEIKYSVKEVGDKEEEKEGKLTLQGYEYSVKHDTANATNQDTITNTVTNASKKTFTAKVTKKWEGGISTNDVIFTFTNKVDANKKRDLKITSNSFKGENTWTGEIQLPKYNDNDNSLAEYTVTEVAVPGFTTTGGENKVVTASNPNVEFTNTRKIQKITVTKDWGATPDVFIKDIKVVLTGEAKNLKDEQVKTIHRGEKTAEFTVPTHTNDGEEIKYTASEQGENNGKIIIDGKEFEVAHPEFNKIVNTYTGLEKDVVKLTIVKKWQGDGRPAVEFEIKDEAGNSATEKNIVLKSDPWTTTVSLPKWDKATGRLKTYTVNEVKTTPTFDLYPFINEDDNKISGVDKTVTFTNSRVMRMLKLEKEWIGKAADQAKFKLEGSGVSKELTLTKDKNWKESVDLPVYDLEGKVINYTITEEPVEGYKAENQPQTFNFVDHANPIGNRSVTFTNVELLKPQFTVHKTWVGEPASKATFGLFADGESAPVDTLELTRINAKAQGIRVWEGKFEKVQPKYKLDGDKLVEIKYVVKELDGAGNPVNDEVQLGDRTFKVAGTPAQDTPNTYNFTNTDITKTDISVTKTWFGKVPESGLVHFGLFKVTSEGLVQVDKENYEVEDSNSSKWKISFKNVASVDENGNKINYMIKEVDGEANALKDGTNVKLGDTNYKVSYDENGNITNTELINLTVNKEWGKNVPEIAKQSVKFRITDDSRSDMNGKSFLLNDDNGWTKSFKDLPLYNAEGEKINYTVVETEINGDEVEPGPSAKKYYHSTFEITAEDAENITKSQTITIKNSIVNVIDDDSENRTINVVKGWSEGAERKPVTVKLYKLDAAKGEIVPVEDGETELREENYWQTKFEVPKKDKDGNEILYYAFETAVGDVKVDESKLSPNLYNEGYQIGEYEVSIAELTSDEDGAEIGNYGFYILNTAHNKEVKPEEKVTINVTKKWLVPKDSEYVKPVNVRLFTKKGDYLIPVSDVKDLTLDANNNWEGKFTDLDKYNDDDKEIEYYVAEVGIGDQTKEIIKFADLFDYSIGRYNVTIDGNGTNDVVITNDVALIDVTAVKNWVGATPRQTVEFTLYSKQGENLVPTGKTVTLNGTDENTVATFAELPRLDNDGKQIVYYVYETKIGETPITFNLTPVETMNYSLGINGGVYAVTVSDNGTVGDKVVIISNSFTGTPVIPSGNIPLVPVVTPIPTPTPTPAPNPDSPVVDIPNVPSPQGPATPVNDGDEDNGVTEIDEDDVPQGDGKEVKKDNKANKDTVDITDNKAPKGTANLPKTGGEAGNFLSIIGLGLIGLGLVIRRRR